MIWAILLLGIIAYYTIGRRCQSALLVAMSLYVYWTVAKWSIVPILVLSLLIVAFGQLLERYHSKWMLIAPIAGIVSSFILLRASFFNIMLPIGLSVVSFTGISYLVDQYRKPRHYIVIDVLCFLLFFPKIFAGPIERVNDFIKSESLDFSWANIYNGSKYLIFAAFTKYIVGDILSVTDFDSLGIGLLFQMLTFGLGFFFDFWAYTLMAIGFGKIFGYNLSISFFKPYYAGSFTEFWHQWNITLGTWLRDYIYIPCGGNRLQLPIWCAVIFLVFIISGLWHGATFPFIVWGLVHATLICVEKIIIKPKVLTVVIRYVYAVFVAIVVALLWQLFIVNSLNDFLSRLQSVFTYSHFDIMPMLQFLACGITMAILTSDRIFNLIRFESSSRLKIIAESTMLALMLATLLIFNCPMSFNFFYFRF